MYSLGAILVALLQVGQESRTLKYLPYLFIHSSSNNLSTFSMGLKNTFPKYRGSGGLDSFGFCHIDNERDAWL